MIGSVILFMIIAIAVLSTGYVVQQQHVAVIERLGKFNHIVGPGFHVKIPFVDVSRDVNLMTEDEHMTFDAKTSDNVTIELDVSIQYRVDDHDISREYKSGVWKSIYTLTDPVAQMRDYFADALRSQIPMRTLDAVFTEKDTIAQSIEEIVSEKMHEYGYMVVATLITRITLPRDVQDSMNRIIASKNNLESAKNDAEADRQKTVIGAQAKAEAMQKEGEGIAAQRKAIAEGIKASLDTIRGAELSAEQADRLFEYTQWVDMMGKYAGNGASTVVLPSHFSETADVFDQIVAADNAPKISDSTQSAMTSQRSRSISANSRGGAMRLS